MTGFPYDRLPRVAGAEAALAARLAAWAPWWRAAALARAILQRVAGPGRVEALVWGAPREWNGPLVRLERPGGLAGLLGVDPVLAVRAVGRVLGDPEAELAAPRALGAGERGVLRYLTAAALDAVGSSWLAGEVVDDVSALGGCAAAADVVVHALDLRARLRLLLAELPDAPLAGALTDAARARLGHLPVVFCAIGGVAELSRPELAALAAGDVVVIDPERAALVAGAARIPARLSAPHLTITEEPAKLMENPNQNRLLADLPVELLAELGRVTLSARAALDLAPGSIVKLGRPPGPIDLTAQGKRIARGDLVTIDGELGVRVTELG